MSYDRNSRLWTNEEENFFRNKKIFPQIQEGSHCVSTTLAILTGEKPEYFQKVINTQDPVSWSEALKPFGMRLAYCPFDVRKIKWYIDELISYDDLFLLSYYSRRCNGERILSDPNTEGWICGSHIVTLHRDKIIDSKIGKAVDAKEHESMEAHTKRIFRVVPVDHERGI